MRNTDDFLEFNNSLVRDDQQAVTTPNSSRSNQETPRMRQSQETQSLTPATVTLSVPELERIVREKSCRTGPGSPAGEDQCCQ